MRDQNTFMWLFVEMHRVVDANANMNDQRALRIASSWILRQWIYCSIIAVFLPWALEVARRAWALMMADWMQVCWRLDSVGMNAHIWTIPWLRLWFIWAMSRAWLGLWPRRQAWDTAVPAAAYTPCQAAMPLLLQVEVSRWTPRATTRPKMISRCWWRSWWLLITPWGPGKVLGWPSAAAAAAPPAAALPLTTTPAAAAPAKMRSTYAAAAPTRSAGWCILEESHPLRRWLTVLGSGALWPVDATIAGLVDTNTAPTGRTLVTCLVDAGILSAITTMIRTAHLLNFMIKAGMEVRGANSEKIEGDWK